MRFCIPQRQRYHYWNVCLLQRLSWMVSNNKEAKPVILIEKDEPLLRLNAADLARIFRRKKSSEMSSDKSKASRGVQTRPRG
jgi:hypothetical protein